MARTLASFTTNTPMGLLAVSLMSAADAEAVSQVAGDEIWKSMRECGSPDRTTPRCDLCGTRKGPFGSMWGNRRHCYAANCIPF